MLTRVTRSRAALAAGSGHSSTTSPPPPITRPILSSQQQKKKQSTSTKPQANKLTKTFKVSRYVPLDEKTGYPSKVYALPTDKPTEPFADDDGAAATAGSSTHTSGAVKTPITTTTSTTTDTIAPTVEKPRRPKKAYVPHPDLGPVPPLPKLPPRELLKAGIAHIKKVSPPLGPVIDKYDFTKFIRTHEPSEEHPFNPFRTIGQGILSQQISGHAAASVTHRFRSLFYHRNALPSAAGTLPETLPLYIEPHFWPTPEAVWATNAATLRLAGLSGRKAEYMHALAAVFMQDEALSTPEYFATLSDAEVITRLTAIHGIGVWSAEMFLIFGLGRWDVFAIDDLGIQRGMAVWAGRHVNAIRGAGGDGGRGKWKYMKEEAMRALAEPFRPFRTLFCMLMWRVGDTNTATLESEDPELVGEEQAKANKKARKAAMREGEVHAEKLTLDGPVKQTKQESGQAD